MNLKIWRLHPKGIRLEPAEKTLKGTAHPAGVKFCKPFTLANSQGFWVYPPVDIDFQLTDNGFEFKELEFWGASEHELVKSLVKDSDFVNIDDFCPISGRSKFTWGAVEPNVVQIWTGCIFQTDPGWCLHLRNPINFPNSNFQIMEGILETDWMFYDIWINVVVTRKNEWIRLRKDQPYPFAQIVPIKRDSLDHSLSEAFVNRQSSEANEIFSYWLQYNKKKFGSGGKQKLTEEKMKDSTTFWKERAANLPKNNDIPVPHVLKPITETKIPPKV